MTCSQRAHDPVSLDIFADAGVVYDDANAAMRAHEWSRARRHQYPRQAPSGAASFVFKLGEFRRLDLHAIRCQPVVGLITTVQTFLLHTTSFCDSRVYVLLDSQHRMFTCRRRAARSQANDRTSRPGASACPRRDARLARDGRHLSLLGVARVELIAIAERCLITTP